MVRSMPHARPHLLHMQQTTILRNHSGRKQKTSRTRIQRLTPINGPLHRRSMPPRTTQLAIRLNIRQLHRHTRRSQRHHVDNPQTRQGSTLIINGTPCYGCAKLIATSGIRRIIGQSDETYAQQDHVHNYLLTNKIETILLTKTETRKIIDTYKNQPLLPNETRLREHTQSTTNTHPNTNPNNHPHNHHPIPRHTTTPNHPKI